MVVHRVIFIGLLFLVVAGWFAWNAFQGVRSRSQQVGTYPDIPMQRETPMEIVAAQNLLASGLLNLENVLSDALALSSADTDILRERATIALNEIHAGARGLTVYALGKHYEQ